MANKRLVIDTNMVIRVFGYHGTTFEIKAIHPRPIRPHTVPALTGVQNYNGIELALKPANPAKRGKDCHEP